MKILFKGEWVEAGSKADEDGAFKRKESDFRNNICPDGKFKPEKDRYAIYVSYACPWACRTLMMRKLKGLEDIISLYVVNPLMLENGWTFEDYPGVIKDDVINAKYMYELYLKDDPNFTGDVTVPVLYDKKLNKIVNNESSEIIRIFNSSFNGYGANDEDFYPEELRDEIDKINDIVYDNINNGVYKAGFATSQEVYESEVKNIFKTLDYLEKHLEDKDYLVGNRLTEADVRLFTSLIRFDPVYFGNFKCNLRQLKDYKNLWNYTKRIYNLEGMAETVNFDHIKNHYYRSHPDINPNGIVPLGPDEDLSL